MKIKTSVNSLVNKLKTRDPFVIADHLDIIIKYVPLIEIRGFCQYYSGYHIIYINNALDEETQKYVCAHELGHILLHNFKGSNTFFLSQHTNFITSKFELDADRFATYLCYPPDLLRDSYDGCTIPTIAAALDVRTDLVEYVLDDSRN